uniref:Uncharacterized protein n=1 Tax=Octopus bimaculoides TaxID=37653 RepID=A0A0L8HCZ7_OCTBM
MVVGAPFNGWKLQDIKNGSQSPGPEKFVSYTLQKNVVFDLTDTPWSFGPSITRNANTANNKNKI